MNNKNFDDIVNGLKNQKSSRDAEDFLKKQLNESQSRKLKELLSDKSAMEQLLSTPQAKELFKKFTEDKNG